MITFSKDEKKLVIPSALGNFGNAGGGSGSGLTPEEAAEIASAVTEAAIEEYDTEIQVDLEDIRENLSATTEDLAALSAYTATISGKSYDNEIEALSGSVNDIRSDVGTLSGATSDILSDIEALSGITESVSGAVDTLSGITSANAENIATLSAATETISGSLGNYATTADTNELATAISGVSDSLANYATTATTDALSAVTSALTEEIAGKQDALTAGKGIFISGNTISSEIEYFKVADYSNFQTLYNDLYSAYTAGKKLILVGTDSSFPSTRDIEIWLDFAEWRNNKFTFAAITKYLIGTQDAYKKIRSYYVTISSNGSVTGMLNGRFTNVWEFGEYSLSAATSTALGGIKVGSGLTMGSDDKLSVNIGDGLAFSGNTLVVSGISGGGGNVFVITDVYGDVSDLSDFLFQYRDAGTGGMTSGYPGDTHILLWLGQDWMGALDPHGQGYVELFPISSYEEEGIYIIELVGVYADNSGNGYAIKIGITDGGTTRGNSANALMNLPREIPQPSFVRFGNDGRGGLTYDADNNRFEYDSGYITPGDTSTVYPDLIDKLFTDYLVDGGMVFDYLLPVNLNRLSVIESGETREYACPSLSRRNLPSTVTIDGVDFNREITYYYGEWKLTAYYGGNDGNEAANVRISRL